MPSATRTTMAVAAAVPLLLLSGGQPHQDVSALHASVHPFPIDCYVTSIIDYGSDAAGLPDLEAIRAELAQQAAESTASLSANDTPDAWHARAWARAAHALSQPDAHSSTKATSMHLTASDDYGRMIAEADYGLAGEAFLNPTPADGYLLQSVTYLVETPPGQGGCVAASS